MTGWRIGYAAANKEIIAGMSKLADHLTSNPTANAQYAALEAYVGSQEVPEKMYQAFEERMERFYPELNSIPGFKPKKPDGAFYFFIEVKEAAHKKRFSGCRCFCSSSFRRSESRSHSRLRIRNARLYTPFLCNKSRLIPRSYKSNQKFYEIGSVDK